MSNTYTDDEFKKVLKNLFTEKKKVKELQKQLEAEGIQKKFQAKLSDIHKLSHTEGFAKIKHAYFIKEKENAQLKEQLEKVRPALRKLVDDLKSARAEIENLKSKECAPTEDFKNHLEDARKKIAVLEELLEKEKKIKDEALKQLQSIKNEKEEIEKRLEKMHGEFENAKDQLQKTDVAALRDEYESKFVTLRENLSRDLAQKEKIQEEILEQSYTKMRELSKRYAEIAEDKHSEIRKAQQHLAKKVKEATLLRDLVEKQKTQLIELQTTIEKQDSEMEHMQKHLTLHSMHEEKLQAMVQERAAHAEGLAKEWQEKFLNLQQDWQQQKGQLIELQKMRKSYDHMAATFSNLKNILGKNTLEAPTTEENHSGH